MKKKITYLGHYDLLRNGKQERVYSLAGARKIDFICDELVQLGFDVNLVSATYSNQKGHGKVSGAIENVRDGITLILAPSYKATNKIERIYRVLKARAWLFFYLLRNCSKNDCVIVYHNYVDALAIVIAQKITGFKLVLQIEEQYSMVWHLSRFQRWKEKILLEYGKDNALVVSELLAERLNIFNPIVSYGNYKVYEGRIPPKRTDGKIVLVFTGMIETVRNGAFISIECMKYLPSNYTLYLSGPVSKDVEEQFYNSLSNVNRECMRKACVYLGMLDDAEYEKLLLSADIALNPQREGLFGDFVFPSKILTYMSYGLQVVSTKGKSILESKLAAYIEFADAFTAESVAKTVQRVVNIPFGDHRDILKKLEIDFRKKLKDRIESEI